MEKMERSRRELKIFRDVWRLRGDIARLRTDLPTAQLWEWKNGQQAGEWIRYVE